MSIKNFKSLALNKERKIALDIVEAGLSALDYEKIDFEKYLNYSNDIPNKLPESSDRIFGKNSGNAFGQYSGIYLIGFGKGSAKIADILRKKVKFKEIYVIDVEPTNKHGFKTDKRGYKINKNPQKSVYDPHESVVVYFKGTHPLPSRKNFFFTKK
jgi:hypothetical protein